MRQQVDARHHKVATQAQRIHFVDACQVRDDARVVGLDQNDLPGGQFRYSTPTQSIVGQSDPRESQRGGNGPGRFA